MSASELHHDQVSKRDIVWLAFEAASEPPGVTHVIWPKQKHKLSGIKAAFEEARLVIQLDSDNGYLVIIDDIAPLLHAEPAACLSILLSLMTGKTIIYAIISEELANAVNTTSPYAPGSMQLLKHSATCTLRVRSVAHVLMEAQARDKSIAPPAFGVESNIDGAVSSPGANPDYGLIVEMDHRRKSGRGTREAFVLSRPKPLACLQICILLDHPLFRAGDDDMQSQQRADEGTTFKMELTIQQKLARDGVVLPHYDAQKLERGPVGDGGKILYDLGAEDDFDEEEDEI